MTKREFIEQYVLNAALGAGRLRLCVAGAVEEAEDAWELMEKKAPAPAKTYHWRPR